MATLKEGEEKTHYHQHTRLVCSTQKKPLFKKEKTTTMTMGWMLA
jgi:hypothetical protein